jgi:hypothetical protein
VLKLRQSIYFPVALAIFWYAFLLLIPFTYQGIVYYQNYVMNAYFWFLVGILFRLPVLAQKEQPVASPAPVVPSRVGQTIPAFALGGN